MTILRRLCSFVRVANLYVVSGPSGAGKTAATDIIFKRYKGRVVHPLSYTTRDPRPGEVAGQDYYFISKDTFDWKVAKGDFLAYANAYGQMYGTDREDVLGPLRDGLKVFLILNNEGSEAVRASGLGAVFIYILPPSMESLAERLIDRGANAMDQRLREARNEVLNAHKYDYVIVNEVLNDTVADLEHIAGLRA